VTLAIMVLIAVVIVIALAVVALIVFNLPVETTSGSGAVGAGDPPLAEARETLAIPKQATRR
jgi:hypothetical protein